MTTTIATAGLYWAFTRVGNASETVDVTPDADSKDSSPDKQEDVMECFQPVLVELGLGGREEAPKGRGMSSLLIASCQYLLERCPPHTACPPPLQQPRGRDRRRTVRSLLL